MQQLKMALTFDDVLLESQYSEVVPSEVDLATCLAPDIPLNVPVVSAAMDTVTESAAAIALAQQGGIGVIHKNMSIERQAGEVRKVKKAESGMIVSPITVSSQEKVGNIIGLMEKYRISGIPVVEEGNKLIGLVTKRDIAFTEKDAVARDIMTGDPITVRAGVSTETAKSFLHENRIEKLPVVDEDGSLYGLITKRDIDKITEFPLAAKDDHKRLRVAAAVGTDDSVQDRVLALVRAGADALVLDSAHADSQNIHDVIRLIRKEYKNISIVVGNVATKEATQRLVDLGVDAVKVGIGAGSICTTRVVAGIGVPQLTAIMDCSRVTREAGICLIADGGIRYSGDMVKALAAGADSVMIGSILAGAEETPGENILYRGRKYKSYRGMGSIGAMEEGSSDRYFQDGSSKFVPEGIEGMIPYKGKLADVVSQLTGGIKSGMGYVGTSTIPELQQKSKFIQITSAGVKESHPHDVVITKEAPNYQIES
jgi:IMP dehydrogenase